jgi:hypothetical protein
VVAPAIALIVVAALHLLASGFALISVFRNMDNRQAVEAQLEAEINKQGPARNPEEKEMRKAIKDFSLEFVAGSNGLEAFGIFLFMGGIILVGAIMMLRLRGRGLAMTASVLSVIPCVSPCCVVGIPFGIWALVSLSQPDVREAFAHGSDSNFGGPATGF